MSKAKRVMQANKRAAFVLDMDPVEYMLHHVAPRLSPRGWVRINRWAKDSR